MIMDGTLDNERAPLQNSQKSDYGPYYQRPSSLQGLNVIPCSTQTSILLRKLESNKEHFVIVGMTRRNVLT